MKKEVFAKFRRDRICDVQELELGRGRVDLNIRRWRNRKKISNCQNQPNGRVAKDQMQQKKLHDRQKNLF